MEVILTYYLVVIKLVHKFPEEQVGTTKGDLLGQTTIRTVEYDIGKLGVLNHYFYNL